jgi:uncharacterized protein (DUF305 family)
VIAGCGGDDGNGDGASGSPSVAPSVVVPSGSPGAAFNSVDVAFASDMIPHHRQAVEMAEIAEPRAGSPAVKDLAVRIRTAQDPEIETLSGWLRDWSQPVPSASSRGDHGAHGSGASGMMSEQEMQQFIASSGKDFDRTFLELMIRHHQGAIDMAATEQRHGVNRQARELAAKIAADQAAEIEEMQDLLATL